MRSLRLFDNAVPLLHPSADTCAVSKRFSRRLAVRQRMAEPDAAAAETVPRAPKRAKHEQPVQLSHRFDAFAGLEAEPHPIAPAPTGLARQYRF